MRVVCLADLHGRIERIAVAEADIRRSDLILLSGDITNFGRAQQAQPLIEAVLEYDLPVLAVPGNCDHPEVAAALDRYGINLDGRCQVLEGLAFVGLGGSLPGPVATPNEYSEEELASRLAAAVGPVDRSLPLVLLSHQPPCDTIADRVRPGLHVGSHSVRQFIELETPLICFTGHIHEGIGVDRIGDCQVINPGPLATSSYAYADFDSNGVKTLEIRRGDRHKLAGKSDRPT